MCRERKLYTTSQDPYCRFIKQFFNEKGLEYKEVDISRNEEEFNELLNFYGTGPLPVLMEDGIIIPLNLLIENAHMTFSGRAKSSAQLSNITMHVAAVCADEYL